MYAIIIEHRAAREFETLPNDAVQQITDVISRLKSAPRPVGVKKLVGGDGWRIRARDYRILYTIDDGKKLITIYRIRHRREAYR